MLLAPPPEDLAWMPDEDGQESMPSQSFEELAKQTEKEKAKALEEIAENIEYLEKAINRLNDLKDSDPLLFQQEIKDKQDSIDDITLRQECRFFSLGQIMIKRLIKNCLNHGKG